MKRAGRGNPFRHLGLTAFFPLCLFLFAPSVVNAAILHQFTSGSRTGYVSAAGVLSWDHTVSDGSDKILVVTTGLHSNSGAVVTGVTFNGSSLTRKAVLNFYYAEEVQLWYLLEPPVGTYRVEVSYSRWHYGLEARASTYTGVNPYRPFSNVATGGGRNAGPAAITVPSGPGELVIDGLAYQNGGVIAADPGQAERYNQRDAQNSHGASEKAGASPSVTLSWALQNSDTWAMAAASLRPAGNAAVRTVSVRPSCSGLSDCYTSLNDAIAGEASYGSLVARDLGLDIELHAMSDTEKVDLTPFNGLTDAEHFIRIHTPASERHAGAWDGSKYHLDVVATISPGRVYPECVLMGSADVWFDGIQLNCSSSCTNYPSLFSVNPGAAAATTLKVSNSLLRGSFSGTPGSTDTSGFRVDSWPLTAEAHLWNNVVQDLACTGGSVGRMIHTAGGGSGDWYVTNTTLYNSRKGLSVSGVKVHVKNSIANGMTASGWTGCAADSDYNVTNLNETITGVHSKNNAVVTFMDAAGGDFRLSPVDAVARDAGQVLWNNPSINDGLDIAGQLRDDFWDIGAFEVVANVLITSGPSDPSNRSEAEFSFMATDGSSSFECQLDSGGYAPCLSPTTYMGLADGNHAFSVRAAGPGQQPVTFAWTIDTLSPDTAISVSPGPVSKALGATFGFSSTEAGSRFECELDHAGYAPCASPTAYGNLAEGVHLFSVRAVDLSGNADPTPATYSWIIDATAPVDGTVNSTAGNLEISLSWTGFSDGMSGVSSYSLVSGTQAVPGTCASGTPLYTGPGSSYLHTGLSYGTAYYYRVCATDGAGNVSAGAIGSATTSCDYVITPASALFGSSGGNGTVSVATTGICGWTAGNTDGWIAISSGNSGTGNGTVSYAVAQNTGQTTRTGTITVGNKIFSITQSGAACSYAISPSGQPFGVQGGTGSVDVTAPGGCGWDASSADPAWITVTSGGSGSGDGSVAYSVSPNSGFTQRTGTLVIAGETFTVTQASAAPPAGAILHQFTSGSRTGYVSAAGVLSWDHTVSDGSDKILVVTTGLHSNSGAVVTGVTFNGSSLTRKAVLNFYYAEEVQLWYLLEPPVGTYRVEVSYSRWHYGLEARASTYTGVNPYRPFSNVATGGGRNAGPAAITVPSGPGELVIDGLAYQNGGVIAADPGQAERYNQRDAQNSHGASEKAGASPSVTLSWALQNSDTWAMAAASLRPAGNAAVRTVSVRPSCSGLSDCYTSLNDAIAGEASYGSLVARDLGLDIELYSMSDTEKVDLTPFNGLTDAEHFIRIHTPASERHAGAWDGSKYHLDVVATISPGRVYPECVLMGSADVWFDGIQLNCSSSCSNYPSLFTVNPGAAATTLKVSNSLLRGSFSGTPGSTDTNGFRVENWTMAAEAHLWNNVVQDLACTGGSVGRMIHGGGVSGDWYVTNTTLYNSRKGLSVSGIKVHVKNSIANGMTASGWSGCAADSDYNVTNLNETITGVHSKNNAVVTFMDAPGRDFRLSPLDTVAKDAGQILWNNPSINDGLDIAGQLRDDFWDIGAFEWIPN
jgi:hypothetical protein